jgi:hypothetical protein
MTEYGIYNVTEYEPKVPGKWGGYKCSCLEVVGPFHELVKLQESNIDKKWGGVDQNKLLDKEKSNNGLPH